MAITGRAKRIPIKNVFKITFLGSGYGSSLRKKASHIKLGIIERNINRMIVI
jgi:hypothetical protein